MNKRKVKLLSMILLGGIVILTVQYLLTSYFPDFTGTDDQSIDLIKEIAPDYNPWFSSLVEFNNENIEPILFALQALIGISMIGFYLLKVNKKSKLDVTTPEK